MEAVMINFMLIVKLISPFRDFSYRLLFPIKAPNEENRQRSSYIVNLDNFWVSKG